MVGKKEDIKGVENREQVGYNMDDYVLDDVDDFENFRASDFELGAEIKGVIEGVKVFVFYDDDGTEITKPAIQIRTGKYEGYNFILNKTNLKKIKRMGYKRLSETVGKNIRIIISEVNFNGRFTNTAIIKEIS